MISVVGDEATEENRGRLNSLMYCGLPVGAIFVAGLGIVFKDISWHTLFLIGGLTPLVLHSIYGSVFLKDKRKEKSRDGECGSCTTYGANFICGTTLQIHVAALGKFLLYLDGELHLDQLVAKLT